MVIDLFNHPAADGHGGLPVPQKATVGRQTEIDAGPDLQGMGSLGIHGAAVLPEAVDHPMASPVKPGKADPADGGHRGPGPLLAHHGGEAQQAGIEVATKLVRHHHVPFRMGIKGIVLPSPQQAIVGAAGLL